MSTIHAIFTLTLSLFNVNGDFIFLPFLLVCISLDVLMYSVTGGTNESDHSESPSTRKCLRKTRGELLLSEYEVLEHHCIITLNL